MKQRADGVEGKGFEDLKAWQLAHQFMLRVHKLSQKFPPEEKYDLFQQIRKASKSIGNNIAEGYGRYHYLDSLRFYYIARGSLNEAISELIQARDLHYIAPDEFNDAYSVGREAERALNGYIAYVQRQKAGRELFGEHFLRGVSVMFLQNRPAHSVILARRSSPPKSHLPSEVILDGNTTAWNAVACVLRPSSYDVSGRSAL